MLFSSILLVAPVESPECFAFCLKILGGGNDIQMVWFIYLFISLRVACYNFESLTAIGMPTSRLRESADTLKPTGLSTSVVGALFLRLKELCHPMNAACMVGTLKP